MKLEEENNSAEAQCKEKRMPQKRYFRQRAHVNPLSDRPLFHPADPLSMDWSEYYPAHFEKGASFPKTPQKKVEILDVGCGYGGLLVKLATLFPDKLALGFEIREKVSRYVQCRIDALRSQDPSNCQNAACIRTNAMKYMLNFFQEGQVTRLFFLFPDPHFKKKKHKWRVINADMMHEYAFVTAEGGLVYTLTDVEPLHEWMKKHFDEHPLFQAVSEEEQKDDPVLNIIWDSSEEGMKVTRNDGSKFLAVYRRVSQPGITAAELLEKSRPLKKRRRVDMKSSDDDEDAVGDVKS